MKFRVDIFRLYEFIGEIMVDLTFNRSLFKYISKPEKV